MRLRHYCTALVALLFVATSALAQPAPAPVADQSPVLFVLNARGAKLAGSRLTLEGVSPSAIVLATRPSRSVLQVATPDLVELWSTGSFARNPPNAALSVFEKDGSGISDAVVVLARPTLAGDTLTFDVAVVNGSIAGADGPASVFIDTIWFQGGEYIGKSKTSGGNTPAIGSRSDTSTLNGWSNPAPSRTAPDRPRTGGASAPPPPGASQRAPSPCGAPHFPPC